VIEFETSFLLGVEAADVALNHFILSHVNLLGLFYNLSDVVPFKFLLIIFKNMLCLERKQNIGPLYHMGLDTVNFNELKNSCINIDLLCWRSFLAKSKGMLMSLLS